ncbi:MAG: enoyl-CoA hydratase/isomerase family protein [Parvibaculaceae bacterium]
METPIILDIDGKIARIVIDREARRNALDNGALELFLDVLAKVRKSDAVCLILTGRGDRAFCAGSDLKALAAYTPREAEHHTYLFQTLTETLDELPCATIAAIEGACLGGGLEIALACDLRAAGETARFGFPEILVGALPTGGGTMRAPRAIGLTRAREMLIFGEPVDAATALDYGLISAVTAQGAALAHAEAKAHKLAERVDREAVALLKTVLMHGATAATRTGQALAFLADVALVRTSAFKSGVANFDKH